MSCNNIPPYRIFTILILFFLLGILFASVFALNLRFSQNFWIILILIIFVAFFNLLLRNYLLSIFAFALLSFFLAASYYSFFVQQTNPHLNYDRKLALSGQIVAKPEVDATKQKVIIRLNNSEVGNSQILVYLPHYPKVYYGDEIQFSGIIQKPGQIDGFDWGRYLRRYLVFGVVTMPQNAQLLPQELSFSDKFYRWLYSVPNLFEYHINQVLPEPTASLSNGLILGLKKNLPDDYTAALQSTGLSHIVALSGYNITIIILAISAILIGHFNRRTVFFIDLVFIVGFVVMTGAAASIIRAAIFSILVIFGRLLGRRADNTNLMLLAALLMILQNPFVLASDVGFQLSFAAFAGIIYLSPILQKNFQKEKYNRWPEWLKSVAAETLSAQIFVLPLLWAVFGKVSFISPLANIVVLPFIPIAMALSFATGMASLAWYPLGKIIGLISWPVLDYIVEVPKLLAKIPFASASLGKGDWAIAVLLYLLTLVYILLMKKKLRIVY